MSRELQKELAKLTGWTEIRCVCKRHEDEYWGVNPEKTLQSEIPNYPESLDAHIPVRREIERRGLVEQFVTALRRLIAAGKGYPASEHVSLDEWDLLTATPEQHTKAAIETLKEGK